MTDTTELETPAAGGSSSRGSLSTMKLDELKQLAVTMGISGTSRMRKSDVLAAIRERGGGAPSGEKPATASRGRRRATSASTAPDAATAQPDGGAHTAPAADRKTPDTEAAERHDHGGRQQSAAADDRPGREDAHGRDRRSDTDRPEQSEQAEQSEQSRQSGQPERSDQSDRPRQRQGRDGRDDQGRGDRQDDRRRDGDQQGGRQGGRGGKSGSDDRNDRSGRQQDRGEQQDRGHQQGNQGNQGGNQGNQGNQGQGGRRNNNDRWSDESGGGSGGRRRRQRGRDRKRGRGRGGDYEVDTQIREDDVLVPVAGILDVLDNYAFVRTSGYLAGPNDVYVPMGMVRKNGLRKGDAITGSVRALRDGEQLPARQKFNALVQLDTVNGMTIEKAKERVDFGKLVPLYPQERLRLEDDQKNITNRVIDLVAPIGKGQRGLIVSPAKAGKTLIMQSIANAITTNNPECHLMVVLVDERPEEVTDFQRAVKGEVISSTFDRPAGDHTAVAELAIERAKRLVEMGHDVVVLLDGITRLGRAYNLAAPASGRIMSGGVDSAALYPPKKFFGAARNIENGGSLTILATALIETGSKMDEVIFEEFKGTGNMELRLSRQLSERRIFPAVDVNQSSTRREEILLGHDELKIMWKLRRVLGALDQQQGIELLLDRLKKTKSNVEFLMQVQQTSSIKLDDED